MTSFFDQAARPLKTWVVTTISIGLTMILGTLNFIVPTTIDITLFYLAPVFFAAWFNRGYLYLVVAVLAATTWFFIDPISLSEIKPLLLRLWNGFAKLIFLIMTGYLVSRIQNTLEKEQVIANIDPLTGLANRHAMKIAAKKALADPGSLPVSIIFIDLDNFKTVNDTQGHETGDRLLCLIADNLNCLFGENSLVSRWGGDEFLVLMPGQATNIADKLAKKARQALLKQMRERNWPVSFSFGIATAHDRSIAFDRLVFDADKKMYKQKTQKKKLKAG